jgi:ribokinase
VETRPILIGRALQRYDHFMTVAVVGSINQDLVLRVPRHPVPGETILGTDHFTVFGGKGANQAVAAARLGCEVAMVGRVGDDDAGRSMVAALEAEGIDTHHVSADSDAGSGLAVITLDDAGENAIVVSPGSNGRLPVSAITSAAPVLAAARVALFQLEVPIDAIAAGIVEARGVVILNPAPAQPLPVSMLAGVSILVPNRTELGVLAGVDEPESLDAVEDAVGLLGFGGRVVVTLGADGAVVAEGGVLTHVPAPAIDPVDTTAAGDAFCGALADATARDEALVDAVRWAVHAGALAATRIGAQPSLPTRDAVLSFMRS